MVSAKLNKELRMRYFVLFLFLSSVCYGGDVEEMRQILEANFAACNNEDVESLLETCSVHMPRREDFKRDSISLWEEKDIYYKLEKFKVLQIEGDYAVASIVQTTLTKDRKSVNQRDKFVRNGTGLLSLSECVEYKIAFKKDNRVWKCYLTLTEPVDYDLNKD